jgi:hypothetical protein
VEAVAVFLGGGVLSFQESSQNTFLRFAVIYELDLEVPYIKIYEREKIPTTLYFSFFFV